MRNLIIILLTFFSLLSSCEKEKNKDPNFIRPLIAFTTADIPTFTGMTQTKTIENSFFDVTKIIDDSYSAQFEFRWEEGFEDYAYFNIRILENHDKAIAALTEMHNTYTNPFISETIDKPSVVGNISYMEGREFIRDNLIIRIHTSENFDDKVTEIAKYIDSKILENESFNSVSQVKPIIEDYSIENNPVTENSQTLMIIKTADPNDKDIFYKWRFKGYGGVAYDYENYYFTSTWYDSENDTVGVTLIAINEYGFCTDSTLNIVIIKE